MKKERVMIAPISGSGMLHSTHALLAYHLPLWSANPNIPFEFIYRAEIGTSPQEYARNIVCGDAVKAECDVLVMIDDDMIVSGTVLDLLTTPHYDIAGPLQYMFMPPDPAKGRDFPECYPCAFKFDHEQPEGRQIFPVYPTAPEGSSVVEAVGSGVIAIRRKVLEDPKMLLEVGMDPPALWKNVYLGNGERIRGLDIDFCRRAHGLGYSIMVNWSVQVGHYKRANLNDVDAFAKGSFLQGYHAGEKHHVESVA